MPGRTQRTRLTQHRFVFQLTRERAWQQELESHFPLQMRWLLPEGVCQSLLMVLPIVAQRAAEG